MDPRTAGERLERVAAIDAVSPALSGIAERLFRSRRLKDALHGTWLGHPLHPVLTDLPLGFWTASWVLDIVGGRRSRRVSDVMIALGLASAVPTAMSGLADWTELERPARRTATVHAIGNSIATLYYLRSLVARARGRRAKGVRLAMTASAIATAAAYLGGSLVYRRGAGVDRNAFDETTLSEWTPVADEAALREGEPVVVRAGDQAVLLVRTGDRICAIGDRCSHLGGPLHEGTVDHAGQVTCPWHGSAFDLATGQVVHGPASAPQPAFDVRSTNGKVEIRARG